MTFERGVVPEDWKSVIVPLHKGKGERTECSNGMSYELVKFGWKNICRTPSRQSP